MIVEVSEDVLEVPAELNPGQEEGHQEDLVGALIVPVVQVDPTPVHCSDDIVADSEDPDGEQELVLLQPGSVLDDQLRGCADGDMGPVGPGEQSRLEVFGAKVICVEGFKKVAAITQPPSRRPDRPRP